MVKAYPGIGTVLSASGSPNVSGTDRMPNLLPHIFSLSFQVGGGNQMIH